MQLGMQGRLEACVGGRVQVVHVPWVAPGVEELVKGGRREVDAREAALLVLGVQRAARQPCTVGRGAVNNAAQA